MRSPGVHTPDSMSEEVTSLDKNQQQQSMEYLEADLKDSKGKEFSSEV